MAYISRFTLYSVILAFAAVIVGTPSVAASPADALFTSKPLATVRFYNKDVKYAPTIENALSVAVKTDDSITFVIRGTSLTGSEMSSEFIREQAEETLLMLRDMDVPSDRIQSLYDADSELAYPMLRIYVR